MKRIILFLSFLAMTIVGSTAQEVITFMWEGRGTNRYFGLNFSADNVFTVDWGNENVTTHKTSNNFAWVYQPGNYNDDAIYQVTINCGENSSFTGVYIIFPSLLTSLDVTQATELIELACPYNKITELNVSNNPKLNNLLCEDNRLIELDLTNNVDLIDLACSYNSLTSLDLSQNKKLETLSCSYNLLTELDLNGNTELIFIWCDNNFITELDFSKNKKLDALYCHNNRLTSLNVNQSFRISALFCDNNLLTNLDLSQNLELFRLGCRYNALTSLDLSNNKNLATLTCNDNCLPLSDLHIASQQISDPELKHLGKQKLPLQTIQTNQPLSLLNEMVLGGLQTAFSVIKDGNPATENVDYKLDYRNQNISFLNNGSYVIILTNEIIVSAPEHPAMVIMPVEVSGDVGINATEQASLIIFPNPVADCLSIHSKGTMNTLTVYDLSGRVHYSYPLNSTNTSIDMNSYPSGIYLLSIEFNSGAKERMKIMKK